MSACREARPEQETMTESRVNPFNVTKASDFNDAEIAVYFVDIPGPGFSALANPSSPMPMLIRVESMRVAP